MPALNIPYWSKYICCFVLFITQYCIRKNIVTDDVSAKDPIKKTEVDDDLFEEDPAGEPVIDVKHLRKVFRTLIGKL